MTEHLSPTTRTDLGGSWRCRALSGPLPEPIADQLMNGFAASVPGVVHTDLLASELIDDPFDAENETSVAWIGRTSWEFTRVFEWAGDGHARHDLVAEGLDTIADVEVNGVSVGRTANHHRSYRFDVRDVLREGTNELRVVFAPALTHAEEQAELLGPRPHANAHPFNSIRKPAYSFGWDWGPDLVTAGIWRDIALEGWSGARIDSVRPVTSFSAEHGAQLQVEVEVETAEASAQDELWMSTRVNGVAANAEGEIASSTVRLRSGAGRAHLAAPRAKAWWPRGYGKQPLYPTTISLATADGTMLDAWSGRLGFRSVTLDTTPDRSGNQFSLCINGREVYVRGANWIPDDSFLPRVTRESLSTSLGHALDANMNLIRVWGGGIYESDDFYDLCDEHGLLVWQDFPLACAAYSEDSPLADEIEAEAREAITRLTAHASLALWNGGNENLWGYATWGWRAKLQGATWGESYYQELFPRLVKELAPGTPYCAGSPHSFDRYLHPNDPSNGSCHIWDVWNTKDYTTYRAYSPRFVSEFGFQGPPAFSTLESVVHDEPRSPYGVQMLVHQKAIDGNTKLERGLGDHLPNPEAYIDWHWATQLNQARAIRFGIDHFRSLFPMNRGAIVWQLNDCWPVVSWSAVDGHGIRKPLWFALRDTYADRLATIQPREDMPVLVLHNDTDKRWESTARAVRMSLDGRVHAVDEPHIDVGPRARATVAIDTEVMTPTDAANEFVVVTLDSGERAFWYFVEDTELKLQSDCLYATAEPAEEGYRVRVQAKTLVKDLTFLVDHVDPQASVDLGLLTLVPGEHIEVYVTTSAELRSVDLTRHPVLRTANDLVTPGDTVPRAREEARSVR